MFFLLRPHPVWPSLRVHHVSGPASKSLLLKEPGTDDIWRTKEGRDRLDLSQWLVHRHEKVSDRCQPWERLASSSLWDDEQAASLSWTQIDLDTA